MTDLTAREKRRLSEQQRLDSVKSAAERNEWGQFATPPALAEEILRYAHTLTGRVRFLDPAIGTGSFYSALRKVFESDRIEAAAGIELDPAFAEAARRVWANSGLHVMEADFTTLEPEARFNLIVSNPPYVRHHHLDAAAKKRLQYCVQLRHRIRISGLAGLYCYFLLLSDAWLEVGGLSIWLIPSEFMDVNYGHAIKQYLTERVELLHIHRFCPADVQFTDALVSSAIVVFRKKGPAQDHEVRMSFGGSLLSPNRVVLVPSDVLREARKWTAYPADEVNASPNGHGPVLGDLFTIKRGIATGANSFFILPEEEAAREGIPEKFRRPILPNPRHITNEVIEADQRGYPSNTLKLALIDCALPEEEIEARFPPFWRYLQRGKAQDIHAAYLASHRSPWYSQEKREPAPFLFTYMGRSGPGRKPFRVIWNKSAATAHNVYLLLYPRGALKRMLEDRPELNRVVFECLRSIDTIQLLGEGRVYGGGLHKMEPGELARVSAAALWEAVAGTSAPPQTIKPEQLALAW
jgi:adenine-specific DNA-methyltransferase